MAAVNLKELPFKEEVTFFKFIQLNIKVEI